ncbi:MAG: aspartate--tRNA(Asn) ligase [Parcubacteria group bacterium CG10_big_fil_rev_8_21_14_0_10_38_31]|nr:MAG: aspartate--tRNA(Asn) ligase [Parcubacteria group bacterium CG10_big_fil_rev_8_21_14_0_10_38_31]
MQQRTLIKDIKDKVGETVILSGWVDIRRDHGKLIFIDLRDASGIVQMVVLPNHEEAHKAGGEVRPEWVVEVEGIVNKRPEKMVNKDQPLGAVEIEVLDIKVLSRAEELPFEKGSEVNLDTYLNHLPLTLRDDKKKTVFKVQSNIIKSFRDFFLRENFVEIQVPKIIGEDAEGGANSFSFDYFGHTAHLAQSPQFYKQIMVGVFEKVFATGNVYRAEKHSTTRHLNEYTSLDMEMGFIKDHTEIMEMETRMLAYVFDELKKNSSEEFKLLGAEVPKVPEKIPALKLREAQEIIKKEHGVDCANEPDLEPQHERWIAEYAKREHNSDFIFITHFPLSKRPMYTYEDEKDPGYANGFDLLFKGIEVTTGGQRIHEYDKLVASIKNKGLDPNKFSFYLQAFKYGMPPHGGFGMGLERLTAKLLNLANVKEATLFPRDLNRIDNLLSE